MAFVRSRISAPKSASFHEFVPGIHEEHIFVLQFEKYT